MPKTIVIQAFMIGKKHYDFGVFVNNEQCYNSTPTTNKSKRDAEMRDIGNLIEAITGIKIKEGVKDA